MVVGKGKSRQIHVEADFLSFYGKKKKDPLLNKSLAQYCLHQVIGVGLVLSDLCF